MCENMARALRPLAAELQLRVTIVDVETDPALEETYGPKVPMLVCGAFEICHYHLDESALRTFVSVKKGTDRAR